METLWAAERWFCEALMEYWGARRYTWVPPITGVDLSPVAAEIPLRNGERARILWPHPRGPAHVGVQMGGKWAHSILSSCPWVDSWEGHVPQTPPFPPVDAPFIFLERLHEHREERIKPLLPLFLEVGGRLKRAVPKAREYIERVFAQEWEAVTLVELFAASRRLEAL